MGKLEKIPADLAQEMEYSLGFGCKLGHPDETHAKSTQKSLSSTGHEFIVGKYQGQDVPA